MHALQIISAPSILGLRPGGVQVLPEAFLRNGLADRIQANNSIVNIATLNDRYDPKRDPETNCLNPALINLFSRRLIPVISEQLEHDNFSLVLGGDCSILLGIMAALKTRGTYGLIFIDAHADFYLPHQSTTGEVADMDLGIVTGHGPAILADIDGLRPYVEEQNVIHVGQRDAEEASRYGSVDIRRSNINCFDLASIREKGIHVIANQVASIAAMQNTKGFWIHFDTDVIDDSENPAVDYRLPGGLRLEEMSNLLKTLIGTGKAVGMTVTIYNGDLDKDGHVARGLTNCIVEGFSA